MSETSFQFTMTPDRVRRIVTDTLRDFHFGSEEAEAFLKVYHVSLYKHLEDQARKFIVEKLK